MAISRRSQEITNNAALAAAGLGIPGAFIPLADVAGMTVIWTKMTVDLAKESGHDVNLEFAGKIITSILAGAGLYMSGSKVMTWLLNLIPGIGTLSATGINAMFNWIYTLRLGKLLATQFCKSGFTPSMLLASASGFASMAFAIPTFSEANDAFHAIGHLLHIGSQAHDVANAASTGADLASHAHNAISVAGDIHNHATNIADAHNHAVNVIHHDATRFSGVDPHPVVMLSASSIFNAPLDEQRQLLQTIIDQHPVFSYLQLAVQGTQAELQKAFLAILDHPEGDALYATARSIRFSGIKPTN